MEHFVYLPNGDKIRADVIIAVRTLTASEDSKIKPRVVVDFGLNQGAFVGCSGMISTICYCDTDAECVALSKHIMGQISDKELWQTVGDAATPN